MSQCPYCQHVFTQTPDRFCPNCGGDLHAAGYAPPAEGGAPAPPPPPAFPPPPGGAYGGGGAAGGPPWERRDALGFGTALIETIRQVFTEPAAFFRTMGPRGIMDALMYAVIVGWVGVVAQTVYQFVFGLAFGGRPEMARYAVGGVQAVIQIVLGPIGIVIGVFVTAAIFHVLLLILGGDRQGMEATVRVVGYGWTASLLNVVPLCGGIASMVCLAIFCIIGLSEAHGIPRGKAATAVLLPFALCCCCLIVLGAVFGATIAAMLSGMNR